MQVPIAPNATSCFQVADTHIHSPHIRQAKSELQTIWDAASMKTGQRPSTKWGPFELQDLQATTDIVLKRFLQNQLLTHRPNHNGKLVRNEYEWPDQASKHMRLPPLRQIPIALAEWRGQVHLSWPDMQPVALVWSQSDTIGNYIHQMYD